MKKMMALMVCLLTAQLSTATPDDKPIAFTQLPAKAQQMIQEHFPEQSIALVKMDNELFDKSYEVFFTDGNKIEFDRGGLWTEVNCKHTRLPDELVPEQIRNYVSKTYVGVRIYKIEKESRNRHEVSLTNGMELKFDAAFHLIGVDD